MSMAAPRVSFFSFYHVSRAAMLSSTGTWTANPRGRVRGEVLRGGEFPPLRLLRFASSSLVGLGGFVGVGIDWMVRLV